MVTGCPEGTYGAGCSSQCPGCRNDGMCDSVTGQCKCTPGFIGDICDQSKTYSCRTAFIRPQTNKIYLLGLRKLQWITQFLSATGGPGFLLEDKEMGKNTKLENFVYISNVFICIINEYYSMYRFYIILDIFLYFIIDFMQTVLMTRTNDWVVWLTDWLIDWLISEPWF